MNCTKDPFQKICIFLIFIFNLQNVIDCLINKKQACLDINRRTISQVLINEILFVNRYKHRKNTSFQCNTNKL